MPIRQAPPLTAAGVSVADGVLVGAVVGEAATVGVGAVVGAEVGADDAADVAGALVAAGAVAGALVQAVANSAAAVMINSRLRIGFMFSSKVAVPDLIYANALIGALSPAAFGTGCTSAESLDRIGIRLGVVSPSCNSDLLELYQSHRLPATRVHIIGGASLLNGEYFRESPTHSKYNTEFSAGKPNAAARSLSDPTRPSKPFAFSSRFRS